MGWKEFLKPNWRIFWIFDIIFILTHIAEIPSPWKGVYAQATTIIGLVLVLIIDLIITYLASCFILWLYEKVKKKK